jgi:hypothetical protein
MDQIVASHCFGGLDSLLRINLRACGAANIIAFYSPFHGFSVYAGYATSGGC